MCHYGFRKCWTAEQLHKGCALLYLIPSSSPWYLLIYQVEGLPQYLAATPHRERNADKTRSSWNTPRIITSVVLLGGMGGGVREGGVRRRRGAGQGTWLQYTWVTAHTGSLLCDADREGWTKPPPCKEREHCPGIMSAFSKVSIHTNQKQLHGHDKSEV